MAGVLARLQVQDADASSTTTTTLFARCRQKAVASSGPDGSSDTVRLPALQLDVAEGNALWRGEVTAEHKPLVLDCSASEYLNTLESVFSARAAASVPTGGDCDSERAFGYKWSRSSGVLTLMEESASGFAMKYTSLTLTPVRDDGGDKNGEKQAVWTSLLQEIVDVSVHRARETTRQKTRIDALESLVREKDAVLETALVAKQQLEDQLFEGFCAVLNAKKDEIQRLQHEVAVAQVQVQALSTSSSLSNSNGKTASSKKPRQLRAVKTKGAKLKRKAKDEDDDDEEAEGQGSSSEEEEAGSQDDDDDDESDSQGEDEDDDEGRRPSRGRRVKRDATDAYSQLSPSIRSSSQVCTADDALSDLDAIMKQEVEANDAIQAENGSKTKRPRASASVLSTRRTQEKKKRKSEVSSQDDEDNGNGDDIEKSQASKAKSTKSKAEPARPPPPAAAVMAMDSEEEDILDMLA